MRSPLLLLGASLLAFTLCSCSSIRNAPKGAPRIEVEVVYEVADSFYWPFDESADRALIAEAARQSIEPLADVGLRFYATPSERYAEGATRPPYVMTVRVTGLEPQRTLAAKEGRAAEGEPAKIEATLRRIECRLRVQLDKRRPNGPWLTVGDVDGVGSARPESEDASQHLPLRHHSNEDNRTYVSERMLRRAIAAAATEAFARIQRPVDREFELMDGPASR